MTNLRPYQDTLGVREEQELVDLFLDSLAATNRTHDFFVDWVKVRNNAESLKTEIALLGSVAGAEDPATELRSLLHKYPGAVKAIPILIAVRDLKFRVLEDIQEARQYIDYDFSKSQLADSDISVIVSFCIRTGITSLFKSVQALRDYVTGVEVGTDTNARKNRSGSSMERLIYPLLEQLAPEVQGMRVITEKKFSDLESLGVSTPPGLKDRRFDIVVLTASQRFNIETNFYAGGGSKPQEIVDSYINRKNELARAGWRFVWVTDGHGWRSGANQMRKAFREMDYILNLEWVRRGLLTEVLTAD
ncbi:MAG: type II restriction endonuclease [Dehalococcoidia bacterium]